MRQVATADVEVPSSRLPLVAATCCYPRACALDQAATMAYQQGPWRLADPAGCWALASAEAVETAAASKSAARRCFFPATTKTE